MTRYSGQWMVTRTDIDPTNINVELSWNPNDPAAVHLTFPAQATGWELSRDLLRQGLAAPAGDPVGEGDLRIAPSLHHPDELLTIDMIDHQTGRITRLHAPYEALKNFLTDTHQVLAPQDEDLAPALNRVLTRILEGQSR